jgi:hypothetical protein
MRVWIGCISNAIVGVWRNDHFIQETFFRVRACRSAIASSAIGHASGHEQTLLPVVVVQNNCGVGSTINDCNPVGGAACPTNGSANTIRIENGSLMIPLERVGR